MTLIRKFWWLALIAGGWLLAHQAHADPYTDAAKTLSDAAKHFDGELLKMRKACVAATVTRNGTAKFKNIATTPALTLSPRVSRTTDVVKSQVVGGG